MSRVTPGYNDETEARRRSEEVLRKTESDLWREYERSEESGETLSFKIAGQEARLRSKNIHTITSVATLVLVFGLCVSSYLQFITSQQERSDAKVMTKEVVAALKDMAGATRENSCIMSFPTERREVNVELCKRLTRQ